MANEPGAEAVRLTLAEVRLLARSDLSAASLRGGHAGAVAETIVAGERGDCGAHRIHRLMVRHHTIRAGKVNVDALPTVLDAAPGLMRIDAQGGYAQLAFELDRPLLADCAMQNGIAAMVINDCVHIAALGLEVESLARSGLVTLACTPSHAWVAPASGKAPLFGTNPLAFGWPRPGHDPFVFDFATSAATRGELELYRQVGRPIPLGWAVDDDGQPTTDAAAGLAGAMLTFGGHKGSALSARVELLAGPLIGDMTSEESMVSDGCAKASPRGGDFVIVIDPEGFLGSAALEHTARAEKIFAAILAHGARLSSTGGMRRGGRAPSREFW